MMPIGTTTADRAERQAPQNRGVAGPTIGELPPEVVDLRNDVQTMFTWMKSSGRYKHWEPYPGFMYKFADWVVRNGSEPEVWRMSEWGIANKMDPSLLALPGRGGIGGPNRANTIRSFETAILNRSTALGMSLTPEVISYIAKVAEAQDYSSEQLMNAIVNLVDFKTVEAGELTSSLDEMRALGRSYLITTSDETLQDYAKKLATGAATTDGIESAFRAQAKALFPWMASTIDAGVSPEEMLRPARDMIAKSLGLAATEVDFTNDRFIKLATFQDEKQGTRLATQQELMKNIRNDEAWASTSEAKSMATGLASTLSRIFGRSVF